MGFLNGEQDNKCVADAGVALINQAVDCNRARLSCTALVHALTL